MRIFCRAGRSRADFKRFDGAIELGRARGQEAFAIGEGPAVVLHIGEFDASGAGRFGLARAFRRSDRCCCGESRNSA